MHPNRRKGVAAEREVAALLSDLLGVKAVRRYNLGTHEDIGDVLLPGTVIQVANYANVTTAVREKPRECEVQQERAGEPFGATFVRLRGGDYRVVLTVPQFCAYWREAVPERRAA